MLEVKATDSGFKVFAKLHPHEAYATYPEQFWEYFQTQSDITREEMEQALKEAKEAQQ